MDALPFVILLVLVVLALPVALGIWLIVRAADARNRIEELTRRVDELQLQVHAARAIPDPPRAKNRKNRRPHSTPPSCRRERRETFQRRFPKPHRRRWSRRSRSFHRNQSSRPGQSAKLPNRKCRQPPRRRRCFPRRRLWPRRPWPKRPRFQSQARQRLRRRSRKKPRSKCGSALSGSCASAS